MRFVSGRSRLCPPQAKPALPTNGMAVEVPSPEEALEWAAKIAAACRCAQEIRAFGPDPELDQMLRQADR